MRRLVDLSKVAAQKLGYISSGLTRVKVEVVSKNTISN
jgi:rare lipoprotein A (peptidoglycan hydrolase)